MLSNILDRISFWSLFLTVVLLPLFFLPFVKIPVETSKGLLLVVGLVISIIFWSAARFSDGKIILPKSHLLIAGLGIVFVFLISAIFSSASKMSFFGIMFDVGTSWFMFSAILLMVVSSVVLRDKKNARVVLLGILLSSGVVFLFQLARIFIPELLSLGILGGKTDNLVGSWNSFGLLAGLFGILSLFLVEFFNVSKIAKWILGASVIFSIILALIVNFALVWELFGIFALIIFVYKISFYAGKRHDDRKAPFPVFSFSIVMISLLFFMSGQFIGGYIPSKLGLSDLEVSPSFSSTMQVTQKALMTNPVIGIGPNRFEEVWAMYKPAAINNTAFWNTSFSSGSGMLPTFAATTGILGILSWLIFLVLLVVTGVKTVFASIKKGENSEMAVFLIASIYLFITSFFYATGAVLLLLAFAFTGMFIGISSSQKEKGEMEFSFLDDPRKSFFSILFLIILMMVSAAVSFKYIQRFVSVSYFSQAVGAQEVAVAESAISKAILLHANDLYFRTYAQVYLAKLNVLVSKGSALSEAEKAELQSNFDQAVNGAILATQYNPTNHLNFQMLGSVYRNVATLGLEDAYTKAIEAYTKASELNPLNPGFKLAIASTYYANKNIKEARSIALEALALKPDYIDALITLSQIEKNDGNTALAISYAEKALAVDPSSKEIAQYVTSLKNNTTAVAPETSSIEVPKEDLEKTKNN